MRTYEVAGIFRADEDKYKPAREEVLALLKELGADSIQEHDMKVRNLSYPIANELHAHYLVFEFKMEPEQAHQIPDRIKYFNDLLRILVTRKED